MVAGASMSTAAALAEEWVDHADFLLPEVVSVGSRGVQTGRVPTPREPSNGTGLIATPRRPGYLEHHAPDDQELMEG